MSVAAEALALQPALQPGRPGPAQREARRGPAQRARSRASRRRRRRRRRHPRSVDCLGRACLPVPNHITLMLAAPFSPAGTPSWHPLPCCAHRQCLCRLCTQRFLQARRWLCPPPLSARSPIIASRHFVGSRESANLTDLGGNSANLTTSGQFRKPDHLGAICDGSRCAVTET